MDKFFFKLSDEDNVAVVRKSLKKGELGALSQIPFGHKISTASDFQKFTKNPVWVPYAVIFF